MGNGLEKKRAKKQVVEDPNHVDVYVSDQLPMWQQTLVDIIKSNIKDSKWPDMKVIAQESSPKKRPELTKYKKKMMPFVALLREQQSLIKEGGTDVLDNVTCNFDQCALLNSNIDYIRPLEIDSISIINTNSLEDSQAIKNEVSPGTPTPAFTKRTGVPVYVKSSKVSSSIAGEVIEILDGDCADSILSRMQKSQRYMKAVGAFSLYRYSDIKLGPRQMPVPFRENVGDWAEKSNVVKISEPFTLKDG